MTWPRASITVWRGYGEEPGRGNGSSVELVRRVVVVVVVVVEKGRRASFCSRLLSLGKLDRFTTSTDPGTRRSKSGRWRASIDVTTRLQSL